MDNSTTDSSSDDEEVIAFVERLGRPRKQRVYRNRADNLNMWDDIEFHHRFRLSKRVVNNLLNLLGDDIKSPTEWNRAVTPIQMLLLTIRFLASGGMLICVGDFIGIHKTTAGKCIWLVLQAICRLKNRFLKFPNNIEDIQSIQTKFFEIARFPKVMGALDCTHIRIPSPGGDNAETYRNRKQFFSINVQAICGTDLQFLNIVARWPGSAHDSRIYQNSRIREGIENGNFGDGILIADSGYAVTKHCITPMHDPHTRAENLFNESIIRTRNVIERAFGVWKRRFPILATGIKLHSRKTQCCIVAAAILHNMAIMEKDINPPPLTEELEAAIIFVNTVPQVRHRHMNNNFRNPFIRYFENLL